MKLEIAKSLVLSIGHISRETKDLIEMHTNDVPAATFEKDDYGWWIYVGDGVPHTCPADLKKLANLARENDCDWLMLDCDGPEIEELETYEW